MPRIVLLEPDRGRRQALRGILRKRAGVFAASKIHEALKAINQAKPDFVVVAIDLGPDSDMHGLRFAKMIRKSERGDLQKIIVYGVPQGKSPSQTKVEQLQLDYQVDLYLAGNWPPEQLASKITTALHLGEEKPSSTSSGRWWQRTNPEVKAFSTDDVDEFSIREALESTSVVTAKMTAISSGDESWKEVLQEDVSLSSIKKLLTKDIRLTKD